MSMRLKSLKIKYTSTKSNVVLYKGKYINGRTSMVIADGDQPWCKPTINMHKMICEKNHTFIRNSGENQGILEELERIKVVKKIQHVGDEIYYVKILR